MSNWPIKKLGEACQIIMGQSPPSTTYNEHGEGLPFYQGKKDFGKVSPVPNVWCSDSIKIVERNDILISVRAPVGALNLAREKSCIGRGLAGIRTGKLIDYQYLYFFLQSKQTEIASWGTGSTFAAISKAHLVNIEIPLPPLEIQKEIVKKIEELFAKIAQAQSLRDSSVRDVEDLISLAIRKNFEEIRKKFDSKELGDITKLVRGPFGGSLRKDIFVKSGFAVYEQGNVIKSKLTDFRYFITTQKFSEMKRFAVQSGDILMSCSGTIGRLAVIPEEFTRGIINQALLKIAPGETITVEYLKYVLQDYISQNIASNTKGSAIKNIVAVAFLKKIKIPLPPIAEQKRIVARMDALTQKVRELQTLQSQTASDLSALKQSILHQAFRGEL